MNPDLRCYECGVSPLPPFDEARYFCKACRRHYCEHHGEYHQCDDHDVYLELTGKLPYGMNAASGYGP